MQDTLTVDNTEIAKFEAMASEWWDLEGKFKPLHMLNHVALTILQVKFQLSLTAT